MLNPEMTERVHTHEPSSILSWHKPVVSVPIIQYSETEAKGSGTHNHSHPHRSSRSACAEDPI